MKFKDYLYNNPLKGLIVDMRLLEFLIPCNKFELSFEHYQSLRIMEVGENDNATPNHR
jgi:hypothetical protein